MQLAQLILLAGLWPTVFAAQGDNCTLTGRPAKQVCARLRRVPLAPPRLPLVACAVVALR